MMGKLLPPTKERQEIGKDGRRGTLRRAEPRIRVKVIRGEQLHWPGPSREGCEIVETLVNLDMRREAIAELRCDVNQGGVHTAQGFRSEFVPELVVITKVSGVEADSSRLRWALEPRRAQQRAVLRGKCFEVR